MRVAKKALFLGHHCVNKVTTGTALPVVWNLLHPGTLEELGENWVSRCDKFADKIDWIKVDLDSRLEVQNLGTPTAPSTPILWSGFVLISPEDVDSIVEAHHEYT